MAHFGMDNQKPIFYIKGFHVESAHYRKRQSNAHLKLKDLQGEASFEVVCWTR